MLFWNPTGARTRGCQLHDWTSKLVAYTRYQQLGQWHGLAQDPALWMQLGGDFIKFCSPRCCFGLALPAPQERCLRTCKRKVKSPSHETFVHASACTARFVAEKNSVRVKPSMFNQGPLDFADDYAVQETADPYGHVIGQ